MVTKADMMGNRLVDDVTERPCTHRVCMELQRRRLGKTTSGNRLEFDLYDDTEAIIGKDDGKSNKTTSDIP